MRKSGLVLAAIAFPGILALGVWIAIWTWTPWPAGVAGASLARSDNLVVFYGAHVPTDCQRKLSALRAGEYTLDHNGGVTIGQQPTWRDSIERTPYAMFNLHSLRFLACPIARAVSDPEVKGYLDSVWRDWTVENPRTDRGFSWPWSEHAAAWRSVVLGYFWTRARHWDLEAGFYRQLAARHARFLASPTVYTPHHNHGLNNALGLLALGLAFAEHPDAGKWRALAYNRATQQMRDNVSADGVHLEQSGFYHFYTLRTFLEIGRVARATGAELPAEYFEGVDAMLSVAAAMAGADGEVEGLPFSDPQQDLTNGFLPPLEGVANGALGAGLETWQRLQRGNWDRHLRAYPEGGYAFFATAAPDELEAVFHTRIVQAPHAHEDALGVTVNIGGEPLVVMPSTMQTGPEGWSDYFHGPSAHNTVQVEGLRQRPLNRRRDGLIATFFDSYKVNDVVAWLGLAEPFTALRRRAGLDRRALAERAVPSGGDVHSVESDAVLEFVAADHRTYPDISHWRSVIRLRGDMLLVWDRLRTASTGERTFHQTFHFPTDARVVMTGERSGRVELADGTPAHFMQLRGGSRALCSGQLRPRKCGWYAGMRGDVTPTPAVRYRKEGAEAEFLWLITSRSERLPEVALRSVGTDRQRLVLTLENCRFRLERRGADLKRIDQTCAE